MKGLHTDSQFESTLNSDRAIIFIECERPDQSRRSASVIREWERTSGRWGLNFQVLRAKADRPRSFNDWLKVHGQQLKSEGGHGSLIWLRAGEIVDFEPQVADVGPPDLSRRTRAAFRKAAPNASPPLMWDRELDG